MATDTYTAKMSLVELTPGFRIVFEAINTTTGAAVANVNVSNIAITAMPFGSLAADDLTLGPFMLVAGPGA